MRDQWTNSTIVLRGKNVRLEPLERSRLEDLFLVAQDRDIWKFTSVDYSRKETFYPNFESAIEARAVGSAYPFLILSADGSTIIGTTRFCEIVPADQKLEIGVTWIASRYFGTGVNGECKGLLLAYCFEELAVIRVQFRANAENLRSRRALEKVGAQFEGVLRRDKILPGGESRNTAFYSIIKDEWPRVKEGLAHLPAAPRLAV